MMMLIIFMVAPNLIKNATSHKLFRIIIMIELINTSMPFCDIHIKEHIS